MIEIPLKKSFDEVQTKLHSYFRAFKTLFFQKYLSYFIYLHLYIMFLWRHLSSRMNGKKKLGDPLTVHVVLIICEYKLR